MHIYIQHVILKNIINEIQNQTIFHDETMVNEIQQLPVPAFLYNYCFSE